MTFNVTWVRVGSFSVELKECQPLCSGADGFDGAFAFPAKGLRFDLLPVRRCVASLDWYVHLINPNAPSRAHNVAPGLNRSTVF